MRDSNYDSEEPLRDWVSMDNLELSERGSITGTFKAVVINERCVVSDYWTKRVKIVVPDEVKPSPVDEWEKQ